MLTEIKSAFNSGLDGKIVNVQVNIAQGTPSMNIVGLADKAINESRERVSAAIVNSGLLLPRKRITVNLAPADTRKGGSAYDLPIAVGLLTASTQIGSSLEGSLITGELGLDGSVTGVPGVLSMAYLAKQHGFKAIYVPAINAAEAALIEGIEVYGISSLGQLIDHLEGVATLEPTPNAFELNGTLPPFTVDFSEIKGQEHVKRALEVSAAGGHNVLMIGAPGAGKTLMARAMPSILPRLTLDEALEVTRIYSAAGQLPANSPLVSHRPFRAPHHTASYAGLVGGGHTPKPGEISLAHRGVLFLDELPEFGKHVLETLRQPLEEGTINISRVGGTLTLPANFMLIAAMNPCRCGNYGDKIKPCTCKHGEVKQYQNRISGPFADRLDIHVEVPRIPFEKLSDHRAGEASATVRARVEAARAIQTKRFAGTNLKTNADMGVSEISKWCRLDSQSETLLRNAERQMQFSARAYHRIIKLARTIADLAESPNIDATHIAEAIFYRPQINN